MKLPAVCLAAAFAGGVALGLFTPLGDFGSSVALIRATFLAVLALLLLSAILLRNDRLNLAGSFSLAAWFVLGLLNSWCGSQPKPSHYVLNLAQSSHLVWELISGRGESRKLT